MVNKTNARFEPGRSMEAHELMETISSGPVPESEWHPDDIKDIRKALARMGLGAAVYRRPDGSLAVFGAPMFSSDD